MPALILLTTLVFSTHTDCIKHRDLKLKTIPEDCKSYKLTQETIMLELYGAHALLQCKDKTYNAYLLEDQK